MTNQNPRPITTEPAEGDLAPTTELLAGLEILRSLPETDFEVPSRYTSRDTLIPGEPITCGDDRVTDVYVSVRGEVEIADHTFVAEGHVHTEPHLYVIARAPTETPELVGPARSIGSLPRMKRRLAIGVLFLFAAATILASAEPFAEGLVESGGVLGIDEFLLVQWLAPLASEAPEFLVAGILAFRGRGAVAIGVLLSSKVNQWTLLVGGLPIAYGLSGGTLDGLPLDDRQTLEVLLTAAQSAFAVALLVGLTLSTRQAILLFALFAVQFVIPTTAVRIGITVVYVVLATGIIIVKRTDVPALLGAARSAYRAPEVPDPAAPESPTADR